MLRRCLATPYPCFGAVPQPRTAPTANAAGEVQGLPEFGTMLEIRNVQMLPDGQIRVETWGTFRFRILDRGTLDGYSVARIERVDDVEEDPFDVVPPPGEALQNSEPAGENENRLDGAASHTSGSSTSSVPRAASAPMPYRTNAELMAVCRDFLEQLREGTPWVGRHLDNYVAMPEDPALFSFWMGLVSGCA